MRFENVLDAVGNTPLIRLNRVAEGLKPRVYVKAEFMNPGGSVKDRIGAAMIDDAERKGLLKPGGTIIEGTSGNTGVGLAMVAALRGYRLIFTITDKQSREKINLLKALGAEVIVCPTAVEPEDPRSYYSVAAKLAREIPNAFHPNQYENPENPAAHYRTTGPEIWRDSEGKVTHFVAGMGTGGTISGVGKCLKERNPRVKIVGVDPIGSLYYDKIVHGRIGVAKPYVVEGIGEDIFPGAMDLKIVDDVVQATDRDSFLMTRKLARLEGLLCGGSGGSAVWGGLEYAKGLSKNDFMVILLPDTGMRYLSKIYNDEWMRENQYVESAVPLRASDVLAAKRRRGKAGALAFAKPSDSLWAAMRVMRRRDISQLPVFEKGRPVGVVHEEDVMGLLLKGRNVKTMIVREVMGSPLLVVAPEARIEAVLRGFSPDRPAVLVALGQSRYEIMTKYDVVDAVAGASEELE